MEIRNRGHHQPSHSEIHKQNKIRSYERSENSTKSSGIRSIAVILTASLSAVAILSFYFLFSRLGIGQSFPLQLIFRNSIPLLTESDLHIVSELPLPPGNIAVGSDGKIFFNFHPEFNAKGIKIALVVNRKRWEAYPNVQFQSEIISCLSMRIDASDRLWLLDHAQNGILAQPKFYAINTQTNEIVHNFTFPNEIAGFGSMLNDFQVDFRRQLIYISDMSLIRMTPAIIVYDIQQRTAHRLLSSHPSMFGNSNIFKISNNRIALGPFGLRLHVDGIALDHRARFLYYSAVTSNKLYRIAVNDLVGLMLKLNQSTNPVETLLIQKQFHDSDLIQCVTDQKPLSDGMTTDSLDNIWLTAFAESAIAIATPLQEISDSLAPSKTTTSSTYSHQVVKVLQSERLLRWPDGFSFGPDGLYITNSALHLKFSFDDKKMVSEQGPFHILRINTSVLEYMFQQNFGKRFILPASGH